MNRKKTSSRGLYISAGPDFGKRTSENLRGRTRNSLFVLQTGQPCGSGPHPWSETERLCYIRQSVWNAIAHTYGFVVYLFHKGKLYNGFSRETVGPQDAAVLAIRNIKQGVLTRGILFDIPVLRGVRFLEPGTPIYPEDLDAWEKQARVHVSSGDVVFIRTGRWARRELTGHSP